MPNHTISSQPQVNPTARASGTHRVYMLAPLVGAGISAAILNRVHKRREVLTHRLCGTHPNGSPL
ncbi:hypothetical protein GCM10009733_098830 [Nonomuraea maheshkhaliensis]|uniref:Uncharacterized protein n=1 Tax=Nonomuraea maheshkhaliensis TaxID=419590 RepID=A0ABN2HEW7_9ACTN